MTRVIDTTCDCEFDVLQLGDYAGQASGIVDQARRDAQAIIEDAKAIARNLKREAADRGYQEGFTRGKSHGYTDGMHQARNEVKDELSAQSRELSELISEIIDRVGDAHEARLHHQSQQTVELALGLSQKIVGHVASADIGAAVENMKKALRLATFSTNITISVNPSQYEQLREWMEGFSGTFAGGGATVQMVPDELIKPGGVIVSSSGGQIDATVDSQLEKVRQALLGLTENDING